LILLRNAHLASHRRFHARTTPRRRAMKLPTSPRTMERRRSRSSKCTSLSGTCHQSIANPSAGHPRTTKVYLRAYLNPCSLLRERLDLSSPSWSLTYRRSLAGCAELDLSSLRYMPFLLSALRNNPRSTYGYTYSEEDEDEDEQPPAKRTRLLRKRYVEPLYPVAHSHPHPHPISDDDSFQQSSEDDDEVDELASDPPQCLTRSQARGTTTRRAGDRDDDAMDVDSDDEVQIVDHANAMKNNTKGAQDEDVDNDDEDDEEDTPRPRWDTVPFTSSPSDSLQVESHSSKGRTDAVRFKGCHVNTTILTYHRTAPQPLRKGRSLVNHRFLSPTSPGSRRQEPPAALLTDRHQTLKT
jgi:hypothetical protein